MSNIFRLPDHIKIMLNESLEEAKELVSKASQNTNSWYSNNIPNRPNKF